MGDHTMSSTKQHRITIQLRTRPLDIEALDFLHKTRSKVVEKLGGQIENKHGLLHHWYCLVLYENNTKYAYISYENMGDSFYHGKADLDFKLDDFKNDSFDDSHVVLEEWTADVSTFPEHWESYAKHLQQKHIDYHLRKFNCQHYCRDFTSWILGETPQNFPTTETKYAKNLTRDLFDKTKGGLMSLGSTAKESFKKFNSH